MKFHGLAITAMAAFVVAVPGAFALRAEDAASHPVTCDNQPVTAHLHRARVLLKLAYDTERPVAKADKDLIAAAQEHRRCIDLANPRKRISELREKLSEKHELALYHQSVTPYAGPSGTWWALPYSIVVCESGADYHVGFAGAYGLLVATWQQWGGPALSGASQAGDADPIYQDIVAHEVWTDVGPVGWECKA